MLVPGAVESHAAEGVRQHVRDNPLDRACHRAQMRRSVTGGRSYAALAPSFSTCNLRQVAPEQRVPADVGAVLSRMPST
jgi:hypothetical protein